VNAKTFNALTELQPKTKLFKDFRSVSNISAQLIEESKRDNETEKSKLKSDPLNYKRFKMTPKLEQHFLKVKEAAKN
jgi:hypothetical protein